MGSGRGGGAIYPDEGSAYWHIDTNVFSNASFCLDDCQWLHIWVPTCHDILTVNSFVDTKTLDNKGTNSVVVNTTLVPKNTPIAQWPAEAQAVMNESGPRAAAAAAAYADGRLWQKAAPSSAAAARRNQPLNVLNASVTSGAGTSTTVLLAKMAALCCTVRVVAPRLKALAVT